MRSDRSISDDDRRLLVIARNRPSTLVAHAAAALGEAASVPVNFHLTSGEIAYIAAESGARLAFVDSTTLEAARDGARRNGCGDRRAAPIRESPGRASTSSWPVISPIELRDDQPVIPSLLFTSGTTGRPKAVQLPPKTVGDDGHARRVRRAQHVASPRRARSAPRRRPDVSQRPADGGPAHARRRADRGARPLRCRGDVGGDRAPSRRELGHGADPLRAAPGVAGRRARPLRHVVDPPGGAHGRQVSDRRQAGDDRVVGAGVVGVVRRHGVGHRVLDQFDRLARPSRFGRQGDPALRGAGRRRRRRRGGAWRRRPPVLP